MEKVTRRQFLTSAGLAGLAAAGAGVAGYAPQAVADEASEVANSGWSWETPPEEIDSADIKEEIEADVLIIGAGMSGLCTALKAAEDGASVVLLEAMNAVQGRGGSIFAMNSRFLNEMGYSIDIGQTYKKMLGYHSYRVDESKWMLHANKSGEAMDWLEERMVNASSVGGNDLFPIMEQWYIDPEDINGEYPGTHEFLGGPHGKNPRDNPQQDVVDNLAAYCVAAGVNIIYGTKALYLVKDESGRVIGCVAEQGSDYIRYLGNNGVVLATGDFGRDEEMIACYCPWALEAGPGGVFDGSGHKMAMWAGAAWQKSGSAAPMIFCFQWINITNRVSGFQGLLLNDEGKRYTNEDNVLSHGSLAMLHQPNHRAYAIWDTAYASNYDWGVQYAEGPKVFETPEDCIAHWDSLVSAGEIDQNGSGSMSMNMVKCDTLEELVEKLGLPTEQALAEIERYNSFCAAQNDEDWHKRADLLHSVEQGPFYGAMCTPWQLTITGGIRCNDEMQALDENNQVIPGLYCTGIMVGDMYNNCYSTHFPGHNLGSTCLTFGYLTGQKLAQGQA